MNPKENGIDDQTEDFCPENLAIPVAPTDSSFRPTHFKKSSILGAKPPPKSSVNQVVPINLKKAAFKATAQEGQISSKLQSSGDLKEFKEKAKPRLSYFWSKVKDKVDDLAMMTRLNREMAKSTFSGKPQSKKNRYECSIYHEGRLMEVIVLIRAISVAMILTEIPLM